VSLARRLLTHQDAEAIVAGLLRDHLGARPGDAAAEAAEARRARNPAPRPITKADESPAESRVAAGPIADRPRDTKAPAARRTRPAAPQAEPSPRVDPAHEATQTAADIESVAQLFVNVGTREGARPSDLQALLSAAGIPTADIGAIRVRDRMTFIALRKGVVDRAVAALSGQVIGGRTVMAELARAR
jgi:hypothetical protein